MVLNRNTSIKEPFITLLSFEDDGRGALHHIISKDKDSNFDLRANLRGELQWLQQVAEEEQKEHVAVEEEKVRDQ